MMPPRKFPSSLVTSLSRVTAWFIIAIILVALYIPPSLAIFAYEQALVPLYALHPTRFLLNKVVFLAIVVAAASPFRWSANENFLLASALVSAAHTTSYLVASRTARLGDPFWGPAVTHLLVLAPIVYGFADFGMRFQLVVQSGRLPRSKGKNVMSKVQTISMKVGVAFTTIQILKHLWSRIWLMHAISDDNIFFVLAGTVLTTWFSWYTLTLSLRKHHTPSLFQTTRSRVFLVSVCVIIGAFMSPSLRSRVISLPRRRAYTHPSYPLQILLSEQSVTGLIVVGEGILRQHSKTDDGPLHSIRYLRASHSILGGVWVGDEINTIDDVPSAVDEQGTALGDSIYSAFVLQEAARLVNSTHKGKEEMWENTLIIGLGTGISASAFMKHNLSTTVIEIDPVVFTAARRFFGMPDPGPGKVFLEDARGWVRQQRQIRMTNDSLFDIIIHDCFSGGGVPKHIFTIEFWEDLKSLMHDEAVIAVNYAGKVGSNASRAILTTLEKVFGLCRAFHDSFEEITEEKYNTEFINIVFFCSPAAQSLTFRQDRPADHLGSPLRKHILSSLPLREVDLSLIRREAAIRSDKFILTDKYNPLDQWQERYAFEHWRLMREVFPDVFWETY